MSYKNHWISNQQFCLSSYPAIDKIYKKVYPEYLKIIREKDGIGVTTDKDRLDHIDTTIKTIFDETFTTQEKIRRPKYKRYQSLCLEYWQNIKTKEKGEYFDCKADYFLYGYLSEDKDTLTQWIILDWQKLKDWISTLEIDFYLLSTKHSKCGFLAIPFNEIPEHLITFKNF